MKAFTVLFFLFFLIIASCKIHKYPTPDKKFSGVIKSCSLDSMVYLTDNELKIIDSNQNINSDCINRPELLKWYARWPGTMMFLFKTQQFVTSYKPINLKDSLSVSLSIDYGSLKYDKKNKTLLLHSDVFNWSRKFKTEYIKSEKALVLKSIE